MNTVHIAGASLLVALLAVLKSDVKKNGRDAAENSKRLAVDEAVLRQYVR